MKFWDSSAVVALIAAEAATKPLLQSLREDPAMIVWWTTPVECASAIARRERERDLTIDEAARALERLRALSAAWHEVIPSEPVRATAQRLLRVHPLRAADALQLSAALVAAERDPAALEFVCLDERLRAAALREGFRVPSLPRA